MTITTPVVGKRFFKDSEVKLVVAHDTRQAPALVVFTSGHVDDEDALHIYDGAADEVICGASASNRVILDSVLTAWRTKGEA